MRLFLMIGLTLGFVSCATLGIKDSLLALQIIPQPVLRGQLALAKINAPMDADSVVGTVQVFGSPQLIFRKNSEKGIWYFSGVIPFSPWVKPGAYQVRVIAHLPHGQPHYTEMSVELK
jgi:hypothetical protein